MDNHLADIWSKRELLYDLIEIVILETYGIRIVSVTWSQTLRSFHSNVMNARTSEKSTCLLLFFLHESQTRSSAFARGVLSSFIISTYRKINFHELVETFKWFVFNR